jgi:phosphoribosylaminoimidazole-succinocarboxamide synthase
MPEPILLHQGKVRDVYANGEQLLLIATDRISAFDVILPDLIPGKGVALTQLARFWFEQLPQEIPSHVLSFEVPEGINHPEWKDRITVCKRAKTIPLECVVRGYLAGSGWNDYQKTGMVQGHQLPTGLLESSRLPDPIFTPSTKAAAGHDEPLTATQAIDLVGEQLYRQLQDLSIGIYCWAHEFALQRGIIIADTKFEFGWFEGGIILIDEILTPDSSRFWPVDSYQPGKSQPSFDKQFVRDYLLSLKDWDRQPPGPKLPADIIQGTQDKYAEVYTRLTGKKLKI